MDDHLSSSQQADAAWQAVLPPASQALKVSVAGGLRVLALRYLAGGAAAIHEVLAAHHLPPLPVAGTCVDSDPWQVWTGPAESLLMTMNDRLADDLVAALRPGCHRLACVFDQSAAWTVFELNGTDVDNLLPRLLDASAVPSHAGQGGRARFVDISAVVMRVGPERWVLGVDRSHERYAAQWIGHAWLASQG